ncbi:cell death abnormality protein 1-like [Bradysia coprophila]|uniref:cell death abnormality protein 1-like n=1 Tax=Bradysia coprophila TaxID=38358 RepID=UPI00187D85E3|nr:cell death abnormality protein 1-like [Bradysia coprophila]
MKIVIQVVLLTSLVILVASNLYGYDCTSNSDCLQTENLECVDQQCACTPGSTLNSRQTCSKSYGGPCQHVLDCNIDTFLKCNDTTSTCDCQQPDRQIFDERRDACVSLIGFTCSHDDTMPFPLFCVEGAYCDMPIINGSMYHYCECATGWEETEDLRCRVRVTGPPNTSRPN